MSLPSIPEITHKIITVSDLNSNVKSTLEKKFPLLWIQGEISNFKQYSSGHWYFSLKDANAQVRCVMFKHKNQYIDWLPKEGMQVELFALVTLYEIRGDYQLNVETIRRAGRGSLFEAFEKLKKRLEKEGLFNPLLKQQLPIFPRQIGIITSPATAALHDVISTLRRRNPMLPIAIYPTLVQGNDAAANIAATIGRVSKRQECDVLIICRGGGSIEDLWAFNEEIVVRSIVACTIPIVCGIGHETDFTIADFVADKRAPTPTGAAEIVSPDRETLQLQLNKHYQKLHHVIQRQIEDRMQKIDLLTHRHTHPGDRIQNQIIHLKHIQERLAWCSTHLLEKQNYIISTYQQRICALRQDPSQFIAHHNRLSERLQHTITYYIEAMKTKMKHQKVQLEHLNPQSILNRGYSITYSAQGSIIHKANQVRPNEKIKVKFAQGQVETTVTKINK